MTGVSAADRDLARWRLVSQRLVDPATQGFDQPQDVVRWMLAMQAQDYGQGLWAIGSRMRSGTVETIEKALAAREIVRSWPMRGTIHWLAPEDVRWMLRLCGSRILGSGSYATRMAQLELTPVDFGRAADLLAPVLEGGRALTRAQAMDVFEQAGLSTAGQRGYNLLWTLAHQELICFGPMQGKQQTFVLLDEWSSPASSRELSGDEALAELAQRYAAARGPVTARDLAFWAGITLTNARRGLAAASGLDVVEIGGVEHCFAPPEPVRGKTGPMLLAGFDEYLLGYTGRGAMVAAEHVDAITPGSNGVFRPMLVVDGQITGTWQRAVKRAGVTLTRVPFVPGGKRPDGAVIAQARRYAGFLGVPLAAVE